MFVYLRFFQQFFLYVQIQTLVCCAWFNIKMPPSICFSHVTLGRFLIMTLLNPVSKYLLDFGHIFSDVFNCHHIKSDGAQDCPTRFKMHYNWVIILHIHYRFFSILLSGIWGEKQQKTNKHVLQLNSHEAHLGVWSKFSLKLQPNQPSHLFVPLCFPTLNCKSHVCTESLWQSMKIRLYNAKVIFCLPNWKRLSRYCQLSSNNRLMWKMAADRIRLTRTLGVSVIQGSVWLWQEDYI